MAVVSNEPACDVSRQRFTEPLHADRGPESSRRQQPNSWPETHPFEQMRRAGQNATVVRITPITRAQSSREAKYAAAVRSRAGRDVESAVAVDTADGLSARTNTAAGPCLHGMSQSR
jgi:hypothetical protein